MKEKQATHLINFSVIISHIDYTSRVGWRKKDQATREDPIVIQLT